LQGHTAYVFSVAFDGKGLLASGSWDNTTKLWNATTGTLINTLQAQNGSISSVAFDGKGLLASAGMDSAIKLWKATTATTIPLGNFSLIF